jgi:hypothetical protein
MALPLVDLHHQGSPVNQLHFRVSRTAVHNHPRSDRDSSELSNAFCDARPESRTQTMQALLAFRESLQTDLNTSGVAKTTERSPNRIDSTNQLTQAVVVAL